jgi:hypothetical protein
MSTVASLVKRINALLAVVEDRIEQVAKFGRVGIYNATTGKALPEYE